MVAQVKLSNNATANCRRYCQLRLSVQCRMETLFAEVRRRLRLRSVEVLGSFGVGDLGALLGMQVREDEVEKGVLTWRSLMEC